MPNSTPIPTEVLAGPIGSLLRDVLRTSLGLLFAFLVSHNVLTDGTADFLQPQAFSYADYLLAIGISAALAWAGKHLRLKGKVVPL